MTSGVNRPYAAVICFAGLRSRCEIKQAEKRKKHRAVRSAPSEQCDNGSDRSQVRVRISRCRLVINMYCKQYRHNIRCEGFVLRTIILIHPFRMVFLFYLAPLTASSPCDIGREPPVCGCYLLRRLALAVRDKASREEEETQSNGCRPKAFSATMFLIGHRFRVLFEAQSLGNEKTPHSDTLEKSRVSVIFMPKIYVTVHDTPFRTCWART